MPHGQKSALSMTTFHLYEFKLPPFCNLKSVWTTYLHKPRRTNRKLSAHTAILLLSATECTMRSSSQRWEAAESGAGATERPPVRAHSRVQQAFLSVGPDIWFSPRAESGRRPETVCDRDPQLKSCSANAHLCTPAGKSSSRTTAG